MKGEEKQHQASWRLQDGMQGSQVEGSGEDTGLELETGLEFSFSKYTI